MTPQDFVAKWKGTELKERSAAQEHFIDLCRLLDQPTPAEADQTGETYAFEKGTEKSSGGQGWADVWKKGCFAWEYKGPGKDLDAAYQQLLQYHQNLENPPLLVVSDIERIIVRTKFAGVATEAHEFGLDDLLDPDNLDQLRKLWSDPEAFRTAPTTEEVTEEAAEQFAKLSDRLRERGIEADESAHFLIRLLFCLFAEDIRLLPKDLFTRLVTQGRRHPEQFNRGLSQLFGAMAEGEFFGVDRLPHFDGGLFDTDEVIALERGELDILARVGKLDWSAIEPAIFGTLFERSLDPSKRSQLGAHYTSREDILLIVEPVLMEPLKRRWGEVQEKAADIAERRNKTKDRRAKTQRTNELRELLMGFMQELASIRVLDPACGSGNFLYVALLRLLDLWKEAYNLMGSYSLTVPMALEDAAPSPVQLRGIEVNRYAHELAETTVWIGYIQWLRENGFGTPSEPILKPIDTIEQKDAVLAYDEDGEPVEPQWPVADIIIGNPPFLGGSWMRRELGDEYTENLRQVFDGRLPAGADLVAYWFEKARAQIARERAERAGLLATQAIRAGASRTALDRIKESGDIFMAWSDRPWILDGASVRVSMVGFDDGAESVRILDGEVVEKINRDLTSGPDVTQATPLEENADIAFQGPSKKGPFEIDLELAARMLADSGNPNRRPNRDVVRPWINASDITQRPRDMWIIDFGADLSRAEAAQYEKPFEYVREHVYPVRSKNRRKAYREYWWRHAEARVAMREALSDLERYVATPRVSKYRLFVWLDSYQMADDRTFVFAREDDYFLGVLHSHIHEAWSLATSSRHGVGNDPTYNNTTCFETYPFPWPPGDEPTDDPRVEAIAEAARELVEKRQRWLNPDDASAAELKKRTLTNLYNERPTWLDLAHEKLDHAVLDAYGWPHDLSDDEILERLLALNLERRRD